MEILFTALARGPRHGSKLLNMRCPVVLLAGVDCPRHELVSLASIPLLPQNGETFAARCIAMQSLVGIWKMVEARAFDDAGNEMPSPLGPEPMGVLLIEAERIMA